MMNVREAYNSWADTYDPCENLTRDLDREITQRSLGHLKFSSILEIGCGTGKNTEFFASIGQRVLSIDFSEGMLKQARDRVNANNVSFSQTDITQAWPVENHSTDLVSFNLVLEHIENLEFIFSEVGRVLSPEGQAYVSEFHPFKQYQGKKARFEKSAGETLEIKAFVHHTSEFVQAAKKSGLYLDDLNEWWHQGDENKPPRIISMMFRKRTSVTK